MTLIHILYSLVQVYLYIRDISLYIAYAFYIIIDFYHKNNNNKKHKHIPCYHIFDGPTCFIHMKVADEFEDPAVKKHRTLQQTSRAKH